MPLSWHHMRMKIPISIRHCEERPMRRGNLIHPPRHSEERILRRENLTLFNLFQN